MGNSLRVSEPYIVDDYSDNDDDDYYSAYETGHSDTETSDKKDNGNPSAPLQQQISVDAAVVSKLVSEVETLMAHLNNQNYDAAYNAALNLQQGGVSAGSLEGDSPKRNRSAIPVTKSPKKQDKQADADNIKNESLQARRSNSDELISDELMRSSDNLCEGIIPEIRTPPVSVGLQRFPSNSSGGDNCDVFVSKGGNSNGDGNLSNGHVLSGEGENTLAWEIDVGDFKSNNNSKPRSSELSKVRRWIDSDRHYDLCQSTTITASSDEIAQRKVLDQKRWNCIIRPQYPRSCGISALVSCWNYLFSTLGNGSLSPISNDQALHILGFQPPFSEIKFGSFAGNATILRWFHALNNHFKVKGKCYFTYKPVGKNKTVGMTSEDALIALKKGLHDPSSAFIYHCLNHYMCPIGYEDTPLLCEDTYRGLLPQDKVETWVLIGDSNKVEPSIQSKRWQDISADLNTEYPEYIDIRQLWKGIQTRKSVSGNLHCIMTFQKVNILPRRSQIPRSHLPVRKSGSTGDRSPMRSGDRSPMRSPGARGTSTSSVSSNHEEEVVFEDEFYESGDEVNRF